MIYLVPLSDLIGNQRVIAASHFYRARTQSDANKSGHGDRSVKRRLDFVTLWNTSVSIKNGRRRYSRNTNTHLFLQNGYTTHGLWTCVYRYRPFNMLNFSRFIIGHNYIDVCIYIADTQEKTVEFTILWLPDRFPLLRAYIFIGILVVILAICFFVSGCCVKSYATYNRLPPV